MRMAGFVLIGGQSSRMGSDKALLPWHSASLVEDIAGKVESAAGTVHLLGDPQRYGHFGYGCLPDRRLGLGPLAGIEAALLSQLGELNLITACDIPGLQIPWLQSLLRSAAQPGTRCTVLLDSNGEKQPLCAVYHANCLPDVQCALEEGRLKMRELMARLNARTVSIPSPLPNVNTPEEWSVWQKAGAQ